MIRKIGIVEPLGFSKVALERLKNIGEVSYYDGSGLLQEYLMDKQIIFVRLAYYLDESILKTAKNLKFVCTPTTGLNHIDMGYTIDNNIEVVSLEGEYNFLSDIRATSEHTFGLIISLMRNYKKLEGLSKDTFNREIFIGEEVFGNNIGIIGFGRVGRLLSKYIQAFDGNCFFYDRDVSKTECYGSKKTNSIEDLICKSDVVVLCASYDKGNDGFFDRTYIDLLKDKYFVNTSRGELVDEDYLLEKIKLKYFKGVAIDVIKNEPREQNNLDYFLTLKDSLNFIITPHIGGATSTSMKRTEEFIVKKLESQIGVQFK